MTHAEKTAMTIETKSATLLVELLTEELPPKSLKALSQALADHLEQGLRNARLWTKNTESLQYATPRRLAVKISHILSMQPNEVIEKKGPSLKVALDEQQQPTKALLGFARACGVEVDRLERIHDGKQDIFVAHLLKKGESIDQIMPNLLDSAIKALPIAKNMRWGALQEAFVRPVHRIVLLYGERVLAYKRWNIVADRLTDGHRFLGRQGITIKRADDYERLLCDQGAVIAQFMTRRQMIVQQLEAVIVQHGKRGDTWHGSDALLDEVTALTEHPAVLVGQFDPVFLDVPQEVLMVSMTQHQKYFPVLGADGQLKPYFLLVANMSPRDEVTKIIRLGNERVLRARLTDARFFYQNDQKHSLASRVEALAHVTYLQALAPKNNKQGSRLSDRVNRLEAIARIIVEALHQTISEEKDQIEVKHVCRAAQLCKVDLVSELVGEFPELQGKAGYYYALADGENQQVAQAIRDHYAPTFAGDALPSSLLGCVIALADKLEMIAGLFGVNAPPTGDKDPYGLRRAALGVIRMMLEKPLSFDLALLYASFPTIFADTAWQDRSEDMHGFIIERLRYYLRELGYPARQVESVMMANPLVQKSSVLNSTTQNALEGIGSSTLPTRFDHILVRLVAIQSFMQQSQATALIAMSKRIRNILKQWEEPTMSYRVDDQYLQEDCEKILALETRQQGARIEEAIAQQDYAQALQVALLLEKPLTLFFEQVMVMSENKALKQNRCALLAQIDKQINRVAALSQL